MKSLFRDLNAVLPAHSDLDAGDGPEVVGGHLGARLGAASGGHSAAPVAAALVLGCNSIHVGFMVKIEGTFKDIVRKQL